MNYITQRRSQTLSNEPYVITYDDIKRMYHENLRDAREVSRVTESSKRGETYYPGDGRPGTEKATDSRFAFFKEVLYRDPKTSGFVMQYPHGVIINQGERNSYFRGENQIYPQSLASLYRSLGKWDTERDRQIYQMVADMRIAEFGIFLFRMNIVQFWAQNYGTVLFEPLAQHYGLETKWLDVTNDFDVALFFATCFWDCSDGAWKPLTKAQTERSEKTQYGVLFHIPGWQVNTQSVGAGNGQEYLKNVILPIGFQPFMRCHSQYAYGIHMERPFALQDDINFEKLHFRHSEKLSRQVYDMMEEGRKIFPQEGLDDFQDVIEVIKHTTSFSEEAFQYAFEMNTFFLDEEDLRRELANSSMFEDSISITRDMHPVNVSRQLIRKLNRKYEGFSIEKAYGIKLTTRMTYVGD